MRMTWLIAAALGVGTGVMAQEIVEIPASEVDVAKPEDLYKLEPGRWHLARQLWAGSEPCSPTQCEAGFTSGDLVVSAEHSAGKVTIVAALRGCPSTAFSELDIGDKASKSERSKIAKQVQRVVKGLGKTCNVTPPAVTALTGDWLFPDPAAG
ncbi:hypothetical protein [Altererythrobacter sp. Root672]|uniref:hypothetical protein n=1 Tax=Altererythrobacter sp. Root672 TaxID=1736584 RepID=UPI000AEF3CD3|nr:hypothetical protein [Altererythrobacter sp. Root672]